MTATTFFKTMTNHYEFLIVNENKNSYYLYNIRA
jgi:hypothetical protein